MITDIVREVTVSSYRHVDNKRTDNTYGNYNHYGAKFLLLVHRPSKHAGSDSEAFWLWSVKAITAGVQPGSGRRVWAESDFPLRSVPYSFKEGLARFPPNASGQSGSKPVCKNHRARFGMNATCPIPVAHF